MFRFRHGAGLALALSILLISGCGGSSTSVYIPHEEKAREALDAALASWQKGGKAAELTKGADSVHFVDSQWDAGQAIDGYQILDEKLEEAETEKRYAVVLKMKKPPAEKRVEYIAVGRSPMWIFRDEDYVKQIGMGEERTARPKRPARGR